MQVINTNKIGQYKRSVSRIGGAEKNRNNASFNSTTNIKNISAYNSTSSC